MEFIDIFHAFEAAFDYCNAGGRGKTAQGICLCAKYNVHCILIQMINVFVHKALYNKH